MRIFGEQIRDVEIRQSGPKINIRIFEVSYHDKPVSLIRQPCNT